MWENLTLLHVNIKAAKWSAPIFFSYLENIVVKLASYKISII